MRWLVCALPLLFSPACASFDQFESFEQRGDAFRALVPAGADIDAKGAASCVR